MTANVADVPRRVPVHFWIIAVLSLLWNAMGAFDYLATQLELEFYMSQFTPEQLDYFYGFPAWAVAAWAFGVWGAFAGSLGLLARAKWAVIAFALSLAGMAVNSVHTFGLSEGVKIMGSGGVAFSAVIWIVAIFLLVYARRQASVGVLR
jgi:hypothetical protein